MRATLYVSETDTSRLGSFPITGEGQVSIRSRSRRTGTSAWRRWVRGGITVCAPTGGLLEFPEAPEPYCTNICFGGDELRTAFITLSGTGRILAVDWPRPGLALL